MICIFAIPLKYGTVAGHFNRAHEFCLINVKNHVIDTIETLRVPMLDERETSLWLSNQNVTHVLASGISQQSIDHLAAQKVEVIWGVPEDSPEKLVKAYIDSKMILHSNTIQE
ncbi:MAG: hypothetical protein K9G76_08820 [Bacteroidales bacterium]|nr:hypothetical protein [Bacteroidales bacterium]MCF8404468.1 hypothetical protein [Bacteroidales bacterium]